MIIAVYEYRKRNMILIFLDKNQQQKRKNEKLCCQCEDDLLTKLLWSIDIFFLFIY